MSIEKDQVCILIPTLNEAPTIGTLTKAVARGGDILVAASVPGLSIGVADLFD